MDKTTNESIGDEYLLKSTFYLILPAFLLTISIIHIVQTSLRGGIFVYSSSPVQKEQLALQEPMDQDKFPDQDLELTGGDLEPKDDNKSNKEANELIVNELDEEGLSPEAKDIIKALVGACRIQAFIEYLDSTSIKRGSDSKNDPIKIAEFNAEIQATFKFVIAVLKEEYEKLQKIKKWLPEKEFLQQLNYFCYKFCGFRDAFLYCCGTARPDETTERLLVSFWTELGEIVIACAPQVVQMPALDNATRLALVHLAIWWPLYQVLYYWKPTTSNVGHLAAASDFEKNSVSHWPSETPTKITEKVPSATNTFDSDMHCEGGPPHQAVLIPEILLIRNATCIRDDFKEEVKNRPSLSLPLEWNRVSFTRHLEDRFVHYEFRKTVNIFKGWIKHTPDGLWSLFKNCAKEVAKYLKNREFFPKSSKAISTPWDIKELAAKLVLEFYNELWTDLWSQKPELYRPQMYENLEVLLHAKVSARKPSYKVPLKGGKGKTKKSNV